MQSIDSGFMRVRVVIVIGVMLAGILGLLSTQVVARAADSVDLTTLSDVEVSVHRWQAMAKYYAGQAALTALTTP